LKERVLNPGDRAALRALVPLAGALGVGTIVALAMLGIGALLGLGAW
jgi:hypothetical protein